MFLYDTYMTSAVFGLEATSSVSNETFSSLEKKDPKEARPVTRRRQMSTKVCLNPFHRVGSPRNINLEVQEEKV
jgi:hypothetical protein